MKTTRARTYRGVPIYGQTAGMCGPASLRSVLGYHGLTVSEKRIVELSNTIRSEGAWAAGLVDAASAFGFMAKVYDNCSIRALCDMTAISPVIVNWWDDGGHYSVVVKANTQQIEMVNPARGGRVVTMSTKRFDSLWYDSEPSVPMLTTRRMIIIRDFRYLNPTDGDIVDVHHERARLSKKK